MNESTRTEKRVIGQCGDGATFQNKAKTARFFRLRRRQRAFLDQGGGSATFLTLISIAALILVDPQRQPYSQSNRNTHNKLMEVAHTFSLFPHLSAAPNAFYFIIKTL